MPARKLVGLLRGWIARHRFAILTATHCRKLPAGRTVLTIDDFFGSSVFTRDPELVLGLQRFSDLTKLVVLKSREPSFEHGQTFEFLFDRETGFYPKPAVDPEERQARLGAIGETAVAWITRSIPESRRTRSRSASPASRNAAEISSKRH